LDSRLRHNGIYCSQCGQTYQSEIIRKNVQCSAVEQTGTFFNLENIAVSGQAKRALCSTLLLAKESNMLSVVTNSGTVILKPGCKISIKKDDVIVIAAEIDGLHRLTQEQMELVAKTAPNKK